MASVSLERIINWLRFGGCIAISMINKTAVYFMRNTTWVINPIRSPSFRLSMLGSAQQSAFAVGVLSDLYAFRRIPTQQRLLTKVAIWRG